MPGDPYSAPPPRRAFRDEIGVDPARLRIAYSPQTPEGPPGHPECLAALEDTARLLDELGHEVTEVDFPLITEDVAGAIGTVVNAAMSWIMAYWIRQVGRPPGPDEIEPGTRALWQAGERVSAATYLLAIEELQRFSRTVADFLADVDLWLTPTLSALPLLIGEMTSTIEDPLRGLTRGAETIRYAGIIANITGNPAMSLPLAVNADGLPIGMHFLARFGDEASLFRLAAQLEQARPWADRVPAIGLG